MLLMGCGVGEKDPPPLEPTGKTFELSFDGLSGETDLCHFFRDANGRILTAIHEKGENVLIIGDPQKRKVVQRTSLKQLNEFKRRGDDLSIHVHDRDSIFIHPKSTRTIYLLNGQGDLLNYWTAVKELSKGIDDYVFVCLNRIPLYYEDGRIYVMSVRVDMTMRQRPNRKRYYRSVPGVIIDLRDTTFEVINKTGGWPDVYKTGERYNDFHPNRCVNEEGQEVYAYGISPLVRVYGPDGRLIREKEVKSDHMGEVRPYPDDSVGNFRYKKQYIIEEPRYGKIVHDPYRDVYYRVVKHGIPYEKENGLTVHEIADKPWSIMILNKELETIDEVKMDPTTHTPYYLFPSPKGLWVSKREEEDGAPLSMELVKPGFSL